MDTLATYIVAMVFCIHVYFFHLPKVAKKVHCNCFLGIMHNVGTTS